MCSGVDVAYHVELYFSIFLRTDEDLNQELGIFIKQRSLALQVVVYTAWPVLQYVSNTYFIISRRLSLSAVSLLPVLAS